MSESACYGNCRFIHFVYRCAMMRHVTVVLVSAVVGSFLATLVWVALEGQTGAIEPTQFIIGASAFTLMFTIPGTVLLMAATLSLADRNFRQANAAVLVVIIGILAGAAMLALFGSDAIPVGAMYGGITAAVFVLVLRVFKAYPARSR